MQRPRGRLLSLLDRCWRARWASTSPQSVLASPLSVENSPFQLQTLQERLPRLLESLQWSKANAEREKLDHLVHILKAGPVKSSGASSPLPLVATEYPNEATRCPTSLLLINKWQDYLKQQSIGSRLSPYDFRPTIVAEMYFYYRIVDAAGFFHQSKDGKEPLDPFQDEKRTALEAVMHREAPLLANYVTQSIPSVASLILVSLLGNKADLSLISRLSGAKEAHVSGGLEETLREQQRYLLADHTAEVLSHLQSLPRGLRRLDVGTCLFLRFFTFLMDQNSLSSG